MTVKGFFAYKYKKNKHSYACSQVPNVDAAFRELFEKSSPSRILEIGTFHGGTAALMRDLLDELNLHSSIIKSFDVYEQPWFKNLRSENLQIIIDNIFTHSYLDISKPEAIESFIQSSGTTIVFCDGGSKINEFKIISKFLKPGDIIMAHDYTDTLENFNKNFKNKIWDWREIGDEHIGSTCEEQNLKPFLKDTMDKFALACFKKH